MTERENFERFHADNPHVYGLLASLSRKWREARPGEPAGIAMLFEVVRWNHAVTTTGTPYKLCNNYKPFYARLLMDNEPDLKGLFRLRRQGQWR